MGIWRYDRWRLPLLPVLLLATTLFATVQVQATTAVPGEPAPDFALKDATGKNVRLSEWRGEVVMLNFWADWCGRCSEQLQELDRLQKQYAANGVRVVAINIDKDAQPTTEASRRLNLMVLHDRERSVARQYDLSDLPLTVLIDAHGNVRFVHEKYRDRDVALYDEELTKLIRE
ncbi:MAG: TlpA disulfide reductase family protein [Gammaproteobacteria bacterium]